MFEALKRLFGKKQGSRRVAPVSDAQRSQPGTGNDDFIATAVIFSTIDGSPGNTNSSCDSGSSSSSLDSGGSCDGGSSGGD